MPICSGLVASHSLSTQPIHISHFLLKMASNQSKGLILVTGGTGFVGSAVILEALRQGYSVRAAVRTIPSRISHLDVEEVHVPDITVPGAFDNVVKGVDYIIHCAAPVLQETTNFSYIIKVAEQGALEAMRAAAKQKTVKRFILTASAASVARFEDVAAGKFARMDATMRTPNIEGPFSQLFLAYVASKVAALNAAEKFSAETGLNLVPILPGFIVGAHPLAKSKDDLLATTACIPIARSGGPIGQLECDIEDVAFVHVKALEESIPLRSYAIGQNIDWNTSQAVLDKNFPGQFQVKDAMPFPSMWDTSDTLNTFGFKYKSYEESTIAVAKQWLELGGEAHLQPSL